MSRLKIYKDIDAELDYAHSKWGDAFDSKNTLNDWAAYTNIYIGKATSMGIDPETQRKNLVKAAGLLVSTLSWLDSGKMPPRHYDGTQKAQENKNL